MTQDEMQRTIDILCLTVIELSECCDLSLPESISLGMEEFKWNSRESHIAHRQEVLEAIAIVLEAEEY